MMILVLGRLDFGAFLPPVSGHLLDGRRSQLSVLILLMVLTSMV
jgi:hypothetical protein